MYPNRLEFWAYNSKIEFSPRLAPVPNDGMSDEDDLNAFAFLWDGSELRLGVVGSHRQMPGYVSAGEQN